MYCNDTKKAAMSKVLIFSLFYYLFLLFFEAPSLKVRFYQYNCKLQQKSPKGTTLRPQTANNNTLH